MEGRCSNCNHFFQTYKAEGASASTELLYQGIDTLITIFSKVQFWQAPTRLKICLKWTPPLTFPSILKPAAYLAQDSTPDVYFLKPKANCFYVKGLHHRRLYSKACDLTLNGISKILWISLISFLLHNIPIT